MDFSAFLRSQKIVVDDPYDQLDLRPKERIAIGKEIATFENCYSVYSEKVFCHICGGHRHFKGITALLEDKTRILFGRKCAADYFGNEVVNLHAKAFRVRVSGAQAQYKILTIQGELDVIKSWLSNYRPLVIRCSSKWLEISSSYPLLFNEITDHLKKNSGRLVMREYTELRHSNQAPQNIFDDRIVGSIRNYEAIPHLTNLSQQLAFVDAFIYSVEGVKFKTNDQTILNLYRLYSRMVRSAEIIDVCLSFTYNFFLPINLSIINIWAEHRRKQRLGEPNETNKRDVAKLMTKIMGSGFPVPAKSLAATITEMNSIRAAIDDSRIAFENDEAIA